MTTVLADPDGTVIVTRLTAYLLLFVVSIGLSYYTVQNSRRETIRSEMWQYVMLAGVAGALYAVTGAAELIAAAEIATADPGLLGAIRRVCQLFVSIFLALAMRELYYESPQQTEGMASRLPIESLRYIEAAFLIIVFAEFMIIILLGLVDIARIVQLAGTIGFTAYGVSFAATIKRTAMTRRTVLDTMLTYIIAILLTAGGASAAEVGIVIGVQPALVESLSIVLTIMSITFTFVLTTRLKQNVDDVSV